MCVCTHVNMCTSTSPHVWKPTGDVQHHPQLLFLYEAVALNQSQSCTLSGLAGPGESPVSVFLCWNYRHAATPTWTLCGLWVSELLLA